MTDRKFERGDDVVWRSSQGAVHGTIVRKVTEPTRIKGHRATASPGEPQYVVECDKSGRRAVHKPSALKKE